MMSYHNKVNTLGQGTNKAEISLVVNLFQSVLDGFIRGEIKRAESELPKVLQTFELSCLYAVLVGKANLHNRFMFVVFLSWVCQTTKKGRKKEKCVSGRSLGRFYFGERIIPERFLYFLCL